MIAHVRRAVTLPRLMAATGLLVLALTALGWSAGVRPMVFTSGSMSPTIGAGALGFATPVDASAIEVGDVVSVANQRGDRVTHRVVAVQSRDGQAVLVLQGDASPVVDPEPYVVDRVDRLYVAVPGLGRVVTVLQTSVGVGVAAPVVVGCVLLMRPRRRGARRAETARSTARGAVALIGGVLTAATVGVLGAVGTSAYWTDPAVAQSGDFATPGSSPNVTGPQCTTVGSGVSSSVLLSWTNVGQRYQYRTTLHRADTGAAVGSPVLRAPQTGGVAAYTVAASDFATGAQLDATGQFNFFARVVAVPAGNTTWVSPTPLDIPIKTSFPTRTATSCGNDTSTTVAITSLGVDTGVSATDFVTNAATNTVRGTGEPGASIVVRRNGTQIGTATVGSDGTWTSTSIALTEGLQDLVAVATDGFGNTATDTRTGVRLDTVLPVVSQAASCPSASIGQPVTGVSGATWCKVTSLSLTATYLDAGSGIAPNGREINDGGTGWTAYTGVITLPESNGRVVQVRATDVAGNSATDTQTYYVDGTAPTATQTATCPLASLGNAAPTGFWCKVTSLSLTATYADATSGVPAAGQQIDPGTGTYVAYTGAVTLPESNGRVVRVRAVDAAGNTSSVDSRTYYLDGTAPTVPTQTSTCPTPGNFVSDSTGPRWCRVASLDVSLSSTDATSGISRYERRSGTTYATVTSPVSIGQGSAVDLTVRAVDVAGNVSADATQAYYVDNVGPSLDQTTACAVPGNPVSGVSGATWCRSSPTLTATYADAVSGMASTGREIDTGTGYVPYAVAVSLADGNPRTVVVRGTDQAGNTATLSRDHYVDTVAPTATQNATCSTLGNPAPTGRWCRVTSLTLTATYADATSGVPTSGRQIDNNTGTFTTYTGSVSLPESNGRVVRVRAVDAAGNTSDVVSQTYYIDGTAPTITFTSPTAGLALTGVQLRLAVNAACGGAGNRAGCGTVTDSAGGSGLVAAPPRFTLRRSAPFLPDVCMNAAGAYATATCAAGTDFATVLSGSTWGIAVAPGTAYPLGVANGYLMSITASDVAGNSATASVSFSTVLG